MIIQISIPNHIGDQFVVLAERAGMKTNQLIRKLILDYVLVAGGTDKPKSEPRAGKMTDQVSKPPKRHTLHLVLGHKATEESFLQLLAEARAAGLSPTPAGVSEFGRKEYGVPAVTVHLTDEDIGTLRALTPRGGDLRRTASVLSWHTSFDQYLIYLANRDKGL